ncbi:uncharacterized protein [Epargyreus clarus]|uniref:uncharacterized protein n=1 Tax=Epargyreus clarus TaxID=520877 RepID=UPI003C2D60B3
MAVSAALASFKRRRLVVITMGEPSSGVSPLQKDRDIKDYGSETNKLLKRIVWHIIEEDKATLDKKSTKDSILRTTKYTGIHKNVISKMLADGKPPTVEDRELVIDRRKIQDSLISMYFKERRMPTVTQLFNALEDLPCYVDVDTFKKILVKMGYVFHMYNKDNTFYVMEKKSVTIQRYKYLKTIQQYRTENVPIYYIGIASVTKDQKILNLEKTLQTDASNITQYILFTVNEKKVQHIKIVSSVSYDVLKMWLMSYVLTELPLQSVCVLEDSNVHRETLINVPTINSVKVVMVEWLEYHNIPCDINMSKSELLKLIETCTNTKDNNYVIDNIVGTYNHKLLRLPECINGVSVAAEVLSLLNKKVNAVETNATILGNMSEALISMLSDVVQKEELRLLDEDIKVDTILDEVFSNTTKANINENDFFFSLSDSD